MLIPKQKSIIPSPPSIATMSLATLFRTLPAKEKAIGVKRRTKTIDLLSDILRLKINHALDQPRPLPAAFYATVTIAAEDYLDIISEWNCERLAAHIGLTNEDTDATVSFNWGENEDGDSFVCLGLRRVQPPADMAFEDPEEEAPACCAPEHSDGY